MFGSDLNVIELYVNFVWDGGGYVIIILSQNYLKKMRLLVY